ncbi:MAG: hypothetical protein QW812_03365, partial [Thermoplasmataceae archaeon]
MSNTLLLSNAVVSSFLACACKLFDWQPPLGSNFYLWTLIVYGMDEYIESISQNTFYDTYRKL